MLITCCANNVRHHHPDDIAPNLCQAFDTPGPVLVGVHVDYRDNIELFEGLHEGSVL